MWIVVAVSAIVLAGGVDAAFARPAGASTPRSAMTLRTDADIAAEADRLSGRTLIVSCARTESEWKRMLAEVGLPSAQSNRYYGFSLVAEGVMRLSPYVCEGLRLGGVASLRASESLQVGWAVDVLLHESVHMGRFTHDESLAEACARVGLPAELNRLYHVTYHSPEMSRLTLAAAAFRDTQGPAYRAGTCVPAA